MQKSKNLDLYAKVEPYIGFDQEYEGLYSLYIDKLSNFDVKSVLDIGCGNGNLLLELKDKYNAKGIDLSPKMVQIATSKGVDARCIKLDEFKESYDAVLAVADVLNYMDKNELKKFLKDVEKRVVEGGIFICDINTLFGFEEVTAGSLNIEEEDVFISIDSEFENDKLYTKITVFEKDKECYKKEQSEIIQYYHTIEDIELISSLKLLEVGDISLFSDEIDKNMLVFQKTI